MVNKQRRTKEVNRIDARMKKTNIRVSARIRPLPSGESKDGSPGFYAKTQGNKKVLIEQGKSKGYEFHEVFEGNITNKEVYDSLGERVVQSVMKGFNATIFMYGQTGSGKTHTMIGKKTDPGLVQLISNEVFDNISQQSESNKNFLVRCRYVEIYNENVFDLLNNRKKLGLKLEDGDSFVADGNKECFVKTFDDLKNVLRVGAKAKTMGVSNINEHSSRSHTIFSIIVESQDNDVSGKTGDGETKDDSKAKADNDDTKKQNTDEKIFRVSTLNLVDLAGSESFSTKFGHTQQQETKSINKSLSALKTVVVSLSKNEKHIPYRNSCLTKLLKSSLGGNAETDIIITLHAGEEYRKESKYTIDFGSLAKKVVCAVKENVASNDDKVLIRKYKAELEKIAEKLRIAEELAEKKSRADAELRELAEMQRNMIGSPRNDGVSQDSLDRILKLQHLLDVEKVGRLQALDTASSRDAFVAETLLKNEMEMEKKLADMRLMMEQEREQMLAQQAINNSIHMSIQQQQQQGNSVQSTMMNQNNNSKANTNSSSVNDLNSMGISMERIDLKEVRDQRREIEKLQMLLRNEKEQKDMLRKALDSAENTIMDLTIQISTMNSDQFLVKSAESQKPGKQ
eukprot:g8021.t1